MESWRTVERPGQFGKNRDEIHRQYDEQIGKGNWRIAWEWDNGAVHYETACKIYEYAYYCDSIKRGDLWKKLLSEARDVYDHEESDVESGVDYLVQNSEATHLQDIAIRNVILKRGWRFEGDKLVQVNSHNKSTGGLLSPGKVMFHMPELIVKPHLKGWWDYNSIEDFYQSNKVLQIKRMNLE